VVILGSQCPKYCKISLCVVCMFYLWIKIVVVVVVVVVVTQDWIIAS
jgi:hypothetical protein